MYTPEPRPPRSSRGGAPITGSVTPQVSDANSVTPSSPRAGYLRRGEAAAAILPMLTEASSPSASTSEMHLATGPSLVFDDESENSTNRRLEISPPPSQLTQADGAQSRLPRQRPRFHTVEDLDIALNQAIEGKINSRNAWASKEASDLLEGITHTIETTLDAAATDDYAGFAKAATVVEGCSKVWTSRVDSTYQQSSQMVQRLLRKDEAVAAAAASRGGEDGDEEGDVENTGEGGGRSLASPRTRSNSRSAAAAARTLAMDVTEINLDSKARTALTQTGVNAQFRAITSKFDQGNAQGLLLNNAPIGRAGNIILDVDYALQQAEEEEPTSRSAQGQASNLHSTDLHASTTTTAKRERDNEEDETEDTTAPHTGGGRTSKRVAVEHDAAVYETVRDLPPYLGLQARLSTATGSGSASPAQSRSARPSIQSATALPGTDVRTSHGTPLDALLLLVPPPTPEQRLSLLKGESGTEPSSEEGRTQSGLINNKNEQGGGDDDDLTGGGFDYEDWGGDTGDYDNDGVASPRFNSNSNSTNNLTHSGEAGLDSTDATDHDIGLDARRLVSGAAEMEAIDTLFHGHMQLALEAEDPTAWCPLSDVAPHPLQGGLANSELSRLHRALHFSQSRKASAVSGAASLSFGAPDSPMSPASKRARKERTIIFQLPPGGSNTGASGGDPDAVSLQFLTKAELMSDAALRQATTAARNITPIGKELLLKKEAASNVLAYTQSSVQRSKAEEAHLILPAAPVPGRSIPTYLPYPIHTQDYFQPFSTTRVQWNLLRKSATGRLIDSANDGTGVVTNIAVSGSDMGVGSDPQRTGGPSGTDLEDLDTANTALYQDADMPVEFFPGGAELAEDEGGDMEGGADFADYEEMYGPEDSHGDAEEADLQYVHGGLRNSVEARLMAQVDVASTAAAAAVNSSSADTSPRSSGGLSTDPFALLAVLSATEATLPTQVDVVRLRQLMWEAVQGQLSSRAQDRAVDLAELREGTSATQQGRQKGQPMETATAVKSRAQAVLSQVRSRMRSTADGAYEEEEEEEQETDGKAVKSLDPWLRATEADTATSIELTRFSDVVRSVLPHIQSVSSTNTLSPAFFFFSMLFLANEHNVVLQSVEGLDDLEVSGIARRVGAAP